MVEIDGVRFRDVSPFGFVFGSLFAIGGVYVGLDAILGATSWQPVLGGIVGISVGFLFAAFIIYADASPEFDGFCEHCGERILANSGSDNTTEHVIVRTTAEPRRLRVAGRSIVTERRKDEHAYCSASCASSDTRYVVPTGEVDTTDPVAQEVSGRAD